MRAALIVVIVLVVAGLGGYAMSSLIADQSLANVAAFCWGIACGLTGKGYYFATDY